MNRALLRRGSTPESSRALGRFELEQMESSHEELLDLLPPDRMIQVLYQVGTWHFRIG